MKTKVNFQGLLFTGILLALVLFSKLNNNTVAKVSFQDDIKNTSLAAISALSDRTPILTKLNSNSSLAVVNSETEESRPFKKEGVIELNLTSKIAFAEDLDSQKLLYSQGTEKRWPIASISKLMTAVIAMEKLGPDKIATISQTAIDTEGLAGDFKLNEKYSIRDMVKIMLFVSSNDAAVAISEFYGQTNFIKEMNMKAAELGMNETNFFDCTGLSVLNQSNTSDLTKLAQYILKQRPEIFNFTKTKELSVVELSSNSVKFYTNINYFAGQNDFLGGKTGFIESSEQNLLSIFSYKGHKILTIILGSTDRFADTQKLFDWVKNSYEF